jgi:hypothetical protein
MSGSKGPEGRGWAWLRAATMFAAALLASCGGGGDGPPPAPAVTVGPPSVTTLNTTVLENTSLADVVLAGTVSGDVASLSGRQVFVIVEDPASLFESAALLQLQQAGAVWNYNLTLRGRALTTPGHRTGNLRVFVCLDAACNTRFIGTPISIPFDVNVVPGLVLSTKTINVTAPFGTVPPDQLVSVAMSSFSSNWVPSDANPFNPAITKTLTIVGEGQPTSASQLTLRLGLAIPGTYAERVRVHTSATIGANLARDFDEFIDITYTITDNPSIDYASSPPSLSLTQSATDTLVRPAPYQFITNFGTVQTSVTVVYDPPPAPTAGPFNSWWELANQTYHSCVGNGTPTVDCLAPGVYTARVQYQLTGPLGTHTVEYPITLTVVP